ncbi:MAG TPA: VTT domain-containing protein [Inquilinus sp.]|nr:VTT domain-containing protein [Inquilinus sp.]
MRSIPLRRWLPVAILLLGLATFFAFGLNRQVSLETLSRNEAEITGWVAANPLAAAVLYVAALATAIAFALPASALLTAASGFLFGVWIGAMLSVLGGTLGAAVLFIAARTAFRDLFHARAGAALARLEEGFRRDGFSYVLFLRFVPIFPSWLVSSVSALLGMNPGRFALATMLGIIPGSLIFASIGADFGLLFKNGQTPDLGAIFQARTLLPLLGLAILSLMPVLYRRWRRRS